MNKKTKNLLKVGVVALAILLCLSLAIGLTGAWYKASRTASGILALNQGIIIDYQGFNRTAAETEADKNIWGKGTTFKLFSTDEVAGLPGTEINLNEAKIRANTGSVDFYARVKLTYEFLDAAGQPVTGVDATSIFKSTSIFNTEKWVDGGAGDGYYYLGHDTTLDVFTKTNTEYTSIFATGAKLVVDDAITGEGPGITINDKTITKISILLTLETLQGSATPEQAAELGWKIIKPVNFAEITEENAKIETTVNKTAVTGETFNVSVNGGESVDLNTIKFPYNSTTALTFESNNVDYLTLNYDNGDPDTFETGLNNTIEVLADNAKGNVTGYIVGMWSDEEYTGFVYSDKTAYKDEASDSFVYAPIENGIALVGYHGTETNLTIPSKQRVRARDFKIKIEGYSTKEEFYNLQENSPVLVSLRYPCKVNGVEYQSLEELIVNFLNKIDDYSDEEFLRLYPKVEFSYNVLCETNILYLPQDVVEIDMGAFAFSNIISVTIPGSIKLIDTSAFQRCQNLTTVILEEGVEVIGDYAFSEYNGIIEITLPSTIKEIGAVVFWYLEDLKTITILAEEPPILNGSDLGFGVNSGIKIYVPSGTSEKYLSNAKWAAYKDLIEEKPKD